jgi:hypothetical protein
MSAESKTVHEVLVAARNLIDREGWKQADFRYSFSPGPGRCAYVALCDVRNDIEMANAATNALVRFIPRSGCPNEDLYDWNDTPGRTKEEVLALFDKAIADTAPPPADPFQGDATPVLGPQAPGRAASTPLDQEVSGVERGGVL